MALLARGVMRPPRRRSRRGMRQDGWRVANSPERQGGRGRCARPHAPRFSRHVIYKPPKEGGVLAAYVHAPDIRRLQGNMLTRGKTHQRALDLSLDPAKSDAREVRGDRVIHSAAIPRGRRR